MVTGATRWQSRMTTRRLARTELARLQHDGTIAGLPEVPGVGCHSEQRDRASKPESDARSRERPPELILRGAFLICSSDARNVRGDTPPARLADVGRHARLAALAAPDSPDSPGPVVADLGCGDGRTVRALLALDPRFRLVHALDHDAGLPDSLLHDERVRSRIVDLDEPLPFEDGSLDRVVSMNVIEALADPAAFLIECHRVLRPGGRAVIGHTDFDTALFASADDALTRQLVDRFVGLHPHWARRADGFMGRKLPGLAADSPFTLVDVHAWADPHRRFDPGSLAWKIAQGMLAAAADDADLHARATDWLAGVQELADQGRFLFTVTDVALVLAVAP
jgi:SAM-dependent methyltransferase